MPSSMANRPFQIRLIDRFCAILLFNFHSEIFINIFFFTKPRVFLSDNAVWSALRPTNEPPVCSRTMFWLEFLVQFLWFEKEFFFVFRSYSEGNLIVFACSLFGTRHQIPNTFAASINKFLLRKSGRFLEMFYTIFSLIWFLNCIKKNRISSLN